MGGGRVDRAEVGAEVGRRGVGLKISSQVFSNVCGAQALGGVSLSSCCSSSSSCAMTSRGNLTATPGDLSSVSSEWEGL